MSPSSPPLLALTSASQQLLGSRNKQQRPLPPTSFSLFQKPLSPTTTTRRRLPRSPEPLLTFRSPCQRSTSTISHPQAPRNQHLLLKPTHGPTISIPISTLYNRRRRRRRRPQRVRRRGGVSQISYGGHRGRPSPCSLPTTPHHSAPLPPTNFCPQTSAHKLPPTNASLLSLSFVLHVVKYTGWYVLFVFAAANAILSPRVRSSSAPNCSAF